MQTIQLKTEEYQLSQSTDNLFQLRPLPSQSSGQIDLEYNFAPLICSKTEKVIRTLPSISQEKSNSTLFYTQIDVQFNLNASSLTHQQNLDNFKSMKNIAQTEKAIYVSKPSSRFCQICQDTFSDYLQHINHTSHQKKLKEGSITDKDFIEIQSILKRKNLHLEKKQHNSKQQFKVSLAFNQEEEKRKNESESKDLTKVGSRGVEFKIFEKKSSNPKKFMPIVEQDDNLLSSRSFGSKKRIVENDSGEKDFVVLVSGKVSKESEKAEKIKDLVRLVSLKTIDSKENKGQ